MWREKGPEVATQREAVTQMHLQATAEGTENLADQMETGQRENHLEEVIMDTSKMDTTCDRHALPPAKSPIEEAYLQHLLENEHDVSVWTHHAAIYGQT